MAATTILPEIHLLCLKEEFSTAFNNAVRKYYPILSSQTKITIHNCSLANLPKDLRFDAVVSPANSYGRLDGAFDDALARAYAPKKSDYNWITRKAQAVLYEEWRGYAPPGTCTVVPLGREAEAGRSAGVVNAVDGSKLPWGTKYLLLCPTMRIPQDVRWDREIAYECVWSLLCAVDKRNRLINSSVASSGGEQQREIKSVLMTPLATGVGLVTATRWAEQCVLAMKHWVEAVENPQVWSNLEWNKILEDHQEVGETYREQVVKW